MFSRGTEKVHWEKWDKLILSLNPFTEAYSEPCQTSKMEHFAEIVKAFSR